MRLSFSPAATGVGNAVIAPDEWGGEVYFTIIGAGPVEEQNRLAAMIVELVNKSVDAEGVPTTSSRSPTPDSTSGS